MKHFVNIIPKISHVMFFVAFSHSALAQSDLGDMIFKFDEACGHKCVEKFGACLASHDLDRSRDVCYEDDDKCKEACDSKTDNFLELNQSGRLDSAVLIKAIKAEGGSATQFSNQAKSIEDNNFRQAITQAVTQAAGVAAIPSNNSASPSRDVQNSFPASSGNAKNYDSSAAIAGSGQNISNNSSTNQNQNTCHNVNNWVSVSSKLETNYTYCKINYGTNNALTATMKNNGSKTVDVNICAYASGGSTVGCTGYQVNPGQSIGGWASDLVWCGAEPRSVRYSARLLDDPQTCNQM